MMTIAKSEISGLIPEEPDRIYADLTQAEVQNQVEQILVAMLQLSNNAAS